MDLRLPTVALLLGGAAACGLAAARSEATVAGATGARGHSGASAYLGGFAALATQALWIRADRALRAHREDEALLYLRAIHDLEPHVVSAARYFAYEIGANLAEGYADPAVRWNLTHEGLRALDTAVAENPTDGDAWSNRASFLLVRISRSSDLAERYRRAVSASGPERAASDDFVAAIRLNPLDIDSRFGLAVAAARDGQELTASGEFADGEAALARSVAAYDGLLQTLDADQIDPGSRLGQEIAQLRESRNEVDELRRDASSRGGEIQNPATTPSPRK